MLNTAIKKVFSMKYPNQQTLFAAIFISLLIFCLIFYFVFISALGESRLLSRMTKEKERDLVRAKALASEYSRLEQEIKKTVNHLDSLKKKLFWEKDISRFLNEVTQLAEDLQIEFVSLKPGIESKSGLSQVPISVALKTSYADLIKFLNRIEQTSKFIRIDSLSIESDTRDIYRQNVKMALSIFVEEKG